MLDDSTTFYALPYEGINVSLGQVLSKGKGKIIIFQYSNHKINLVIFTSKINFIGSVSEIVARWLSSAGVNPTRLIDTTDIEFDQLQLSIDSLKVAGSLDEAKAVELLQQDSKTLLSVSVEIGSEAKADQTALTIILGTS